VTKLNGLKALYECAFKHGHLKRDDFEIASPFNPSETISLFEFVRMLRNNLFFCGDLVRRCGDRFDTSAIY
jgi:hypothetical protein